MNNNLASYPQLPLDNSVIDSVLDYMIYSRSIERDKMEVRLVKVDDQKVSKTNYKLFVFRKSEFNNYGRPTTTIEQPQSKFDQTHKADYNSGKINADEYWAREYYSRHSSSYASSYSDNYIFSLEEASGETPEEAICKFFTEAVKTIMRQKKFKEKEFARIEKELAAMDYTIAKLHSLANPDEIKEPESTPEVAKK